MNGAGNGRIVCNFCGEDIASDAKRCPYCGSVLGIDRSHENYEAKTENFSDNSSKIQDIGRAKSTFDNFAGSDNNGRDLRNEEKVYEADNGLPETNANDKVFGESEKPANQDNSESSYTQAPQEPKSLQEAPIGSVSRQQSEAGRSVLRQNDNGKPSISNAMKVFCTSACTIVPGLGQLIGIIIAIVCMNSEGDTDKRSFGLSLLVNCIIVFIFMCIACCIAVAVAGD